MGRRILFLFLGLTLAGTSLAWAQPGRDFGGGGFQDRLQEVKRNQLGPALGVNQQTVDKLLAVDARYKPMRQQLIAAMRNDMNRLQQVMSQAAPPEQEIRAILGDMKRNRLEMLNLQQREDDEETAILTPIQQARYLMYLRSLIKEARSIKSGTGGPGNMGGAGNMGGPGGTGAPGNVGGPGGMGAPAFLPSEIPVSRPPQ
jgi:hypothetical protein